MSRAVELARKCGLWLAGMASYDKQIEAFYHAARAEALREAAEEVHKLFLEEVAAQTPRYHDVIECCAALRAMADREGVQ